MSCSGFNQIRGYQCVRSTSVRQRDMSHSLFSPRLSHNAVVSGQRPWIPHNVRTEQLLWYQRCIASVLPPGERKWNLETRYVCIYVVTSCNTNFFASLALCRGNPSSMVDSPKKGPVMWNFNVFSRWLKQTAE